MAGPLGMPLGHPLLQASWITPSLVVTGILAAYVLLVLARPLHTCFRCGGKRHRVVGIRVKPCGACRSTGRQQWPGARLVHRVFWLTIGHRMMDRRRARIGGE